MPAKLRVTPAAAEPFELARTLLDEKPVWRGYLQITD
jgi:hypothetical protein